MLGANLENFTIDQFAGALALSLGAIGSLLLVIWQSKCHCKVNLCYIFTCERKPSLDVEQPKDLKKKDKKDKKNDVLVDVENEIQEEIIPLTKNKDREAEELEYVNEPISP